MQWDPQKHIIQTINSTAKVNQVVFSGELSTSTYAFAGTVYFEQLIFDLVVTLTFHLLTS